MDIAIKKVGQRDGKERFVLVDAGSRQILTVHDASERSLRKFFEKRGTPSDLVDKCFFRARERYEQASAVAPAVNEAADTMEDDDLLFELGLGEEDRDIH